MQVVIDIPESILNTIQADEMISREQLAVLQMHILKGTPLPKGHGTLKDVDNIKTAFPSGEYVRTESVRVTIDHEDTIIEADKVESEKV